MHDDRRLQEQRIRRELAERLPPLVHPESERLSALAGTDPEHLTPITPGDRWGRPWGTTWFRLGGKLREAWRGRRVEAIIDLGFDADAPGFQCEGLVFGPSGEGLQGVHPRRRAVPVDSSGGTDVELTVEAASNPLFPPFRPSPMGSLDTAPDVTLYRFRGADVVLVDEAAASLATDLEVLDGVMRTLDERDPRRAQLLAGIIAALDALPDVHAAANQVAPLLAAGARQSAHHIVACGHAHIDTAWLWPTSETVRKCGRTFTSAVAMMDADPGYRFACSQAQHYAWVEEHDPVLFARIGEHVAGGQWIPVGGMWVEADMNLPSGESIVRQLVFGQRYFESHFGVRCAEIWIPDVFGYPAGLPQVFAAGGITRFVTQKLSWNKTNRFPHHTFWWEGLDGTRVLTHFPPVDTYNAELTPAELAFASANFSEHRWSRTSLMPFGYGDGGGGPTVEMVERGRRLADLDGMPTLEIGTPSSFFEAVEGELAAGAEAPVWRGELYFETHRGTLTSQLATKLGNRRCERLLFEVELWAAAAGRAVDVDDLWREVLTQQFHDILPGSSIAWVHADAEAVHLRVAGELEQAVGDLLAEVAPGETAAVVANPASRPRFEVIEVDPTSVPASSREGETQALGNGRVAVLVGVDAFAVAPLRPQPSLRSRDRVVVTDSSMRNRHLAVRWAPDGTLSSIIDSVRGRELVPAGAGAAAVELAVDHPIEYDAWDVEEWTRAGGTDPGGVESIEVIDEGPLAGKVVVRRAFGPSTVDATYCLRAESPRLDIEIDVDWHHDEHLLSMVFPFDVRADVASCDVQFGTVQRPTHGSTSWDAAKFEVCAHRFVALAEPSFGAAVLNDGRYGHGLLGGAVRVSLARAARYPDPNADRGRHRVTLSVMPFGGDLADVSAQAELLNRPIRVAAPGRAASPVPAVVDVLGAGVDVDAVKLADDGSGDLIVRLHEACGDRVPVTVRCAHPISSASWCDLYETPTGAFEASDGVVAFTLRPFQLVTLRLSLAAG